MALTTFLPYLALQAAMACACVGFAASEGRTIVPSANHEMRMAPAKPMLPALIGFIKRPVANHQRQIRGTGGRRNQKRHASRAVDRNAAIDANCRTGHEA
jgi:hypothetical protein